jgi:RND family efflux transporter MFP subunit
MFVVDSDRGRRSLRRRYGRWQRPPRVFPLALVALLAAGCGQGQLQQTKEEKLSQAKTPPVVRVVSARMHSWAKSVRVQGSLVGDEQAVVGAKVAGRVREVKVDLGSVVRQGQVLCELDPDDFDLRVQQVQAQLEQARSALGLSPNEPDSKLDRQKAPPVLQEKALMEEARSSVERARPLVSQKIMTNEELQQREAALRVAEARFNAALNGVDEKIALIGVRRAELAVAKKQQQDAVTVAPFDGMVQERHVAAGVYLNVGQPVVTLVRTDPLRFRAGVPERQALEIDVGQHVRLMIEGQADATAARVTRISPSLDLSNRSLVIECDVPNSDGRLRAGLFAEAEVMVDPNAQALTVPASAVSEFAGVEKLWVVKDGQAQEREIFTGRRDRDLIEIVRGLADGEMVISNADQGHAGKVAVATEPVVGPMNQGGE